MTSLPADSPIQVDSRLSEDDERTLANDVLHGLTKYPTRTELAILQERAGDIVNDTGALGKIAGLLSADDRLLLGTDLVKDPRVIEAAYNDSAGITAEFNRNLLHVVNRELAADLEASGLALERFYTDDEDLFSLSMARPAAG